MKLPLNCEVEYINNFIDKQSAKEIFDELYDLVKNMKLSLQTETNETYDLGFGKIMFLDQNLFDNNSFPVEQWGATYVWTKRMKSLKEKIEMATNQKFEVCVLIYYADGNSGVDYHSDYVAFGDTSIIPSVSLGEEREFKFRSKENGDEFSTILENGSLVIMGEHCQDRYEHSLPIDPKYCKPRINLTFRKYGFSS